ncbi:MAG TPA: HutD family protein [Flavipsychrobacter sp.]|nr:HutD family protein [Flavipsychrobacter sp.]
MSVQQFSAMDRTTINWASGTSTELFIHPAKASFAERNFQFRISTATVEAEESTFTFFEGVTRHLMILKGNLELIHEGHYTKHLKPYEQDIFSGEWKTRSKGKVTDFNLMLKEGATGLLRHQRLDGNTSVKLTASTDYYFIYLTSGLITFQDGKLANAGDFLYLKKDSELILYAKRASDLVLIEVSCSK